jgi:hypothetical protein
MHIAEIAPLAESVPPEAIGAIERIPTLDRQRVRAGFESRFTSRHMAESYRRCFERLVAGGERKTTHHGSRSSRGRASELTVGS